MRKYVYSPTNGPCRGQFPQAIAVLSHLSLPDKGELEQRLRFLDLASWARLRKSNFFLSFQTSLAKEELTVARGDFSSPDEKRLLAVKALLDNEHLEKGEKDELQITQAAFGSVPMSQKVLYMLQDSNRLESLQRWFPENVPASNHCVLFLSIVLFSPNCLLFGFYLRKQRAGHTHWPRP